jgi:hypothetical protein
VILSFAESWLTVAHRLFKNPREYQQETAPNLLLYGILANGPLGESSLQKP